MSSSSDISFLGNFSSTHPHAGSLLTPRPFASQPSGETKDALIHIAIAQVLPDESGLHADADDETKAGLEKLELWASAAAEKGADVVVFPEYFLSGATHDLWRRVREAQRQQAVRAQQEGSSEMDKQGPSASEAEGGEKAWIEIIIQVAQKYDIDIVAGTVVELGTQPHAQILADHPVSQLEQPTTDAVDQHDKIPHRPKKKHKVSTEADEEQDHEDQLFNTSYYISRRGQVLHRYTKQNLWHPERKTLLHSQHQTHPEQHAGPSSTFVIETKRGTRLRAAMAICWDLAWYSRFYQMISPPYAADQVSDLDRTGQAPGPDVIFAPTCWYASDGGAKALLWNGVGEAQMLDTLCLARAVELEAVLVMCNVSGPKLDAGRIEEVRNALERQHDEGVSDEDLEVPLVGLGRSRICAPFLNVVAEVPDERQVMLLQSVDLNLLIDAREMYRMRYDHAQR
ncbi:hydrolase, carbon-nitrogen [Pseudozyma hubeiensis SY62]|uniref:Hydrolase, carbon-nitrogen n=1 Tax=Pseudozyma hubeiensis (strain SY62) TaxID=1305764 RepID=R9NYR0_PSEHS|nr:hydrolase, carbon-nitrogen [Pseudozyma hubeiensis SY62]GAC93844.1 hydrolase, carbon-nitrogen [Pseudozyma hubeiensis SY62]